MRAVEVIQKPVRIIIIGDIHDPVGSKEDYSYPAIPRGTVRDYIPAHVDITEHLLIRLNGHIVNQRDWLTKLVAGGDELVIVKAPGGVDPVSIVIALVVSAVIGFGLSYVARLFVDPPKDPDPLESPTTGGDQIRTKSANALPIPIVYGEYILGGNVIRSTTGHFGGKVKGGQNYSVSIGGFRNNLTLGLCEGPIQAVAGYTVPQQMLWFGRTSGISDSLYSNISKTASTWQTLSAAGNTKLAFKFTVKTAPSQLKWMRLFLRSAFPNTPPTMTVQEDTAGSPSGLDLFIPITPTTISGPFSYKTFTLTKSVTLQLGPSNANKDYWVVLEGGDVIDLGTTTDTLNGNMKAYSGSWGATLAFRALADISGEPDLFISSNIGVKIDGSPIDGYSADGFVSLNLGTVDQEAHPGSSGVVLEQNVNQKLPLNRAIQQTTQNGVDGIGVVISFPNGYYVTDRPGNRKDADLEFEVTYWISGFPATTGFFRFKDSLFETGSSALTYRIDFSTEKNKPSYQFRDQILDVEVKMINNNGVQFPIIWKSLQEYSDDQAQSYPYTATMQLDTDIGSAVGPLGDVTVHVQGKKVHQYDSNGYYDTYGYLPSPAWCAVDLALNQRYGGGKHLTTSNVDLVSASDFHDHCTDQINDGNGGVMDRWALGLVIDEVKPLDDWLTTITAAADAKLLRIGNKLKFKESIARSPSQTFSDGNTLAGTFKQQFIGKKNRPNIVKLTYRDAGLDFAKEVIQTEVVGIREEGEPDIPELLDAQGVTHPVRAFNLAERHARRIQYTEWTAEVTTFIGALACEPGDVVALSASAMDPKGLGGRLKENAPGANSIKLDKDLDLDSAGNNYQITITTESAGEDSTMTATIDEIDGQSFSAGDTIDITPSWSVTPSAGDVYSIRPIREQRGSILKTDEAGGVEAEVVSFEITDDFFIRIQLVNYDSRVFDEPVLKTIGARKRFIPTPLTPSRVPDRPLSLQLKSRLVGQPPMHVISCSWIKAVWPFNYNCAIYGRIVEINSDRFTYIGDSTSSSFDIPNMVEGLHYEVAICPRSPGTGRHHNPASVEVIRRKIFIPRPYSANRTAVPSIP